MLDLLIIGGSIAGTTAAVYAARRKLDFVLVSSDLGGEVALSGEIENWPGVNHTTGIELAENLKKQLEHNSVTIDEGFTVYALEQTDRHWTARAKSLSGEERTYEALTVLVATGVKPKHLNVPGENELYQHGVTYCTTCDGPLFRNKITTTIGGGNSALESALMMASIAKHVYVVNKNEKFKGDQILIDKLSVLPNVEIIYGAMTQKIDGAPNVSSVEVQMKDGSKRTVESQGVMIHIGNTPNSFFVPAEKDTTGQVIVDALCRTNLPGLYAAGDITNTQYKQIVVAAGMGCTAALAAIEYINRFEK